MSREATASLRVSYCRDPEGVTAEQLLALETLDGPRTTKTKLRGDGKETGQPKQRGTDAPGLPSAVRCPRRGVDLVEHVPQGPVHGLSGREGAVRTEDGESKLEKKGWTSRRKEASL